MLRSLRNQRFFTPLSLAVGKRLICVGDCAELRKRFTREDVTRFAEVSLDNNPIHLDEAYAAKTRFKKPIVHGVLVNGLLSALMGTRFPGNGCVYVSHMFEFPAPRECAPAASRIQWIHCC